MKIGTTIKFTEAEYEKLQLILENNYQTLIGWVRQKIDQDYKIINK